MVSITIRFPEDVKEELNKKAKADSRSVNSYVVRAVKEKMGKDNKDG